MKVVCGGCQAAYELSDEKVDGRMLRIQCRACGAAIIVGGETASAPPNPGDAWYVSAAEQEHGPMATADLLAWLERAPALWDAHVWRDGMPAWVVARDLRLLTHSVERRSGPVVDPDDENLETHVHPALRATGPSPAPAQHKGGMPTMAAAPMMQTAAVAAIGSSQLGGAPTMQGQHRFAAAGQAHAQPVQQPVPERLPGYASGSSSGLIDAGIRPAPQAPAAASHLRMSAPLPVPAAPAPPRRRSLAPVFILAFASLAAAGLVAAAFVVRSGGLESTPGATADGPGADERVQEPPAEVPAAVAVAPGDAIGNAIGEAPGTPSQADIAGATEPLAEAPEAPADPGGELLGASAGAEQPGADGEEGPATPSDAVQPKTVRPRAVAKAQRSRVRRRPTPQRRPALAAIPTPAPEPQRAERAPSPPDPDDDAPSSDDDDPLAGLLGGSASDSAGPREEPAPIDDPILRVSESPASDAEPTGAEPTDAAAADPLGPATPTVAAAKAPPEKRSVDDLLDLAVGGGESQAKQAPKLPATPSRSAVLGAMEGVRGDVQRCAKASGVTGVAKVMVTVQSSGKVIGAKATGVPDSVAGCIGNAVRHARFSPFERPTFSVNFPFRLR